MRVANWSFPTERELFAGAMVPPIENLYKHRHSSYRTSRGDGRLSRIVVTNRLDLSSEGTLNKETPGPDTAKQIRSRRDGFGLKSGERCELFLALGNFLCWGGLPGLRAKRDLILWYCRLLRCTIRTRRRLYGGVIVHYWRTMNRMRSHSIPPLPMFDRPPQKEL